MRSRVCLVGTRARKCARFQSTTSDAAVARPPTLLRSVMYVPAINKRALEKSRASGADGLIIDLEDGSGGDEPVKTAARANAIEAITAGGFGSKDVAIRVNGLESPWFTADVEAVGKLLSSTSSLCLHVCLPKVGKKEDVATLCTALADAGAPDKSYTIWAMLETPLGVLNAGSIASSVSGGWDNPALPLSTLVAGTTDLCADLRARPLPGRQHVMTALSTIVMAARAYGLAALDGVSLDVPGKTASTGASSLVDSPLYAECSHGRSLGFDGKTLIHPGQIEAANGVFGPSEEEVALARRIIEAWTAASTAGKGVAVLQPEGRLVENLHAEEAKRTLALAQAVQARMGKQ